MTGAIRSVLAAVGGACLMLATAAGCDKKSSDPATEGEPTADDPAPSPAPAPPPETAPETAPPAGSAQPRPALPHGDPGTAPAADISGEDLDKFASALEKVREVEATYGAKIKGAETRQEAQSAQQEAMSLVEAKLSKVGMTMEDYSKLAQQISADPELQARLESRLE